MADYVRALGALLGTAPPVGSEAFRADGGVRVSGGLYADIVRTTSGTEGVQIAAGSADLAYQGFYARSATPGVRTGFLGFVIAGGSDFYLQNEIAGGKVNILPAVQVNGATDAVPSTSGTPNGLLRLVGSGGVVLTSGVMTSDAGAIPNYAWVQARHASLPSAGNVYPLKINPQGGGVQFGAGIARWGGTPPASKPTITGNLTAPASLAALGAIVKQIVQALAAEGAVTDGTT